MFFRVAQMAFPMVQEMVYVNTVGPRFETRAEIRSYRGATMEGMDDECVGWGGCWMGATTATATTTLL